MPTATPTPTPTHTPTPTGTSTSTPTNIPTATPTPTVDAGPDQTANEGDEISFSSTVTDGLNTYTIQWDFGDGAMASGTLTPTHTYADNDVYTVTLNVSVHGGAVGSDTLLVTVDNVPPAVGLITAPMDLLAVSTTITASASVASIPNTPTTPTRPPRSNQSAAAGRCIASGTHRRAGGDA